MFQCRVSALAICLLLLGCAEQGATTDTDLQLESVSEQESPPKLGVIQPGSPEPGEQAPDFALLDGDKQIVRLSDFRGKPIILNFFASWCAPCIAEMPLIQATHLKGEELGYVVLGIVVQDSRAAIRALSEDMGLTFPWVIDGDDAVGIAYHVAGPPVTVFIDENGTISSVVSGQIHEDTMEQALAKLLR